MSALQAGSRTRVRNFIAEIFFFPLFSCISPFRPVSFPRRRNARRSMTSDCPWWRSRKICRFLFSTCFMALAATSSHFAFQPRPFFHFSHHSLDVLFAPFLRVAALAAVGGVGAAIPRRIATSGFFIGVFLIQCILMIKDYDGDHVQVHE